MQAASATWILSLALSYIATTSGHYIPLYIQYIWAVSHSVTAILAKISKICVKLANDESIRIELCGANVELAPSLQIV